MQENMTSFVKESEPETIIPVVATCKLNEWCIVQPSSGTADRRFIDAWGMNHFNTCFQANTLQLAKKTFRRSLHDYYHPFWVSIRSISTIFALKWKSGWHSFYCWLPLQQLSILAAGKIVAGMNYLQNPPTATIKNRRAIALLSLPVALVQGLHWQPPLLLRFPGSQKKKWYIIPGSLIRLSPLIQLRFYNLPEWHSISLQHTLFHSCP